MFYGFSFSWCSLFYWYSLSNVRKERPYAALSVILLTELKVPSAVWRRNDCVPSRIPVIDSIGPSIKPCAGFSIRSWIPKAIFLNNLFGWPSMFSEPAVPNKLSNKIWSKNKFWYLIFNLFIMTSNLSY